MVFHHSKKKGQILKKGFFTILVIIIVLAVLVGILMKYTKMFSKTADCEGGEKMCVKTSAECTKVQAGNVLSLKACKTKDSKKLDGRCCVASPLD